VHRSERLDLSGADLREADLAGANLSQTDLAGAHLEEALLENANLTATHLEEALLTGARLSGARLEEAHLAGAHLEKAVSIDAYLVAADLRGAHLERAMLAGADLAGAYLEEADLTRANLARANLRNAHLERARLEEAHLAGAHLERARLEEAHLAGAYLEEADLTGANLAEANLTLSRFIRCDLDDAVVDDALVTDIDVQNLRSLPKPPETLRLHVNGTAIVLTGADAKEFFILPAIVEVYVTTALTPQELACYHLHIGEVYYAGIATGVYLVGHRHEGSGSALRFQAKSYEEIYMVLPDLLAPFRMAQAVDWKQTIQSIPAEKRGEAITALATVEPKSQVVEWHFAKRMAEIFDGYRNANVTQLSEWGSRRLRIEIVENPEEVQRLSQMTLPEPWDGRRPLMITQGQNSNLSIGGGNVGNNTEVHGDAIGSAFDSGTVNARDIIVYKNAVDSSPRLDNDIKQKLKEAREAIEKAKDLSDADKKDAVDQLNNLTAELEKPEKDDSRVKRYWNRIKEVAPTGASILASAASLAKLLGGG
jgi:uncharacterized protein YjbI with pentapeptide repeats